MNSASFEALYSAFSRMHAQKTWDAILNTPQNPTGGILDRENRKLSDEKSPAGKVDYHTMGAVYDIVAVLPKA